MPREFLTVVTGLPRSGTSMMMKMLEAGGMPVMTDEIRTADDDNPRGYYELEAVKRTKEDPSWIDGAAGKAVKMVYSLMYDMPSDLRLRAVVMRREIKEILHSQRKMLQRHDNDDEVEDALMASLFDRQMNDFIAWLPQQANVEWIEVSYNNIMEDPLRETRRIAEFLTGLNAEGMASIVDTSLYRNRQASR